MTETGNSRAARRTTRRRGGSRLTIPSGFRKRFAKLGYRIRKKRLKPFFLSPACWLIEPIERSESKLECSDLRESHRQSIAELLKS